MEGHRQEKLATANERAADMAAEAATAAAQAVQKALEVEDMHCKAVQQLQDETQANLKVSMFLTALWLCIMHKAL